MSDSIIRYSLRSAVSGLALVALASTTIAGTTDPTATTTSTTTTTDTTTTDATTTTATTTTWTNDEPVVSNLLYDTSTVDDEWYSFAPLDYFAINPVPSDMVMVSYPFDATQYTSTEFTSDVVGDLIKDHAGDVAKWAADELAKLITGQLSCGDAIKQAVQVVEALKDNLDKACVGMGGVKSSAKDKIISLLAKLVKLQAAFAEYGTIDTICDLINVKEQRGTYAGQLEQQALYIIQTLKALLADPQQLCESPPNQLVLCDCDLWVQPRTLPPSDVTKKRVRTLLQLPSSTPPTSCEQWAYSTYCGPNTWCTANCNYGQNLGPEYAPTDLDGIIKGQTAGIGICRNKGWLDNAGVCNGDTIGGGGQLQCISACGLTYDQVINQGIQNACYRQCYKTVGDNCHAGTCSSFKTPR